MFLQRLQKSFVRVGCWAGGFQDPVTQGESNISPLSSLFLPPTMPHVCLTITVNKMGKKMKSLLGVYQPCAVEFAKPLNDLWDRTEQAYLE